MTPANATIEPSIERRPIRSCRNKAASRRAIKGAINVSAIAWASGTRPMPQKNKKAITVKVTSPSGSCVLLNNAAFEQVREPGKFLIRRAVIERVG